MTATKKTLKNAWRRLKQRRITYQKLKSLLATYMAPVPVSEPEIPHE